MSRWALGLTGLVLAVACTSNREPGGVVLPPSKSGCPRGLGVASSDYASTTISVCGADGKVLREAMLTSGSRSAGVSQALSGDVVLPTSRPASGRMVLIDRYPNSVISFVDVDSAAVTSQLNVSTGFPANPHDYVETRDGRALVTRYEKNPRPGREPFDAGSDVLVLDTRSPKIVGRIELSRPGDDGTYQPRPDRMLGVGDDVWVLLQRFDGSFKGAADGRLIGIDGATEAIAWSVDLVGAANCGAMALSPSGKLAAIACSGVLGDKGATARRAAVIVLDTTKRPPVEVRRVSTATPEGAPFAPQIGFASDQKLVAGTYGSLDDGRTDKLVAIDTGTGAVAPLVDVGAAFALGDVRCAAGCGGCFVADAKANALRVFYTDQSGAVVESSQQPVDRATGLPPRYVGFL